MSEDAASNNTPVTVPDAAAVGTPPPGPAVAVPKKRRGRPPKSSRSVSPPPVAAAIAAATDTEEPVKEPTITATKTRIAFTAVKLGDEVHTNAPGDSEEAARERFREELRQRFIAAAQRAEEERLRQQQQEAATGYVAGDSANDVVMPAERLDDARESLKRAIDMLSYAGVAWLVTRFLGVL